jgi:hypothetical protein
VNAPYGFLRVLVGRAAVKFKRDIAGLALYGLAGVEGGFRPAIAGTL